MNSYRDPFGLNLLFELFKGNKTVGGCIVFLMKIVTFTIFIRVLWDTLSQSLPAQTATQWTLIITLGVIGIYGVVRLVHFIRSPLSFQDNKLLSIASLLFALILGGLGFLMLNATFDSTNSEPPGVTFFLLFYGLPVGSLIVIGMIALSYLQVKRLNGLMITSIVISLPLVAIFGLWHFLALGLSGDYYPCLVDAVALAGLTVLVVVFARRNRSSQITPSTIDDSSLN